MALGATVYKAQLSISDLDRNWYGEPVLTLARHPSETETRLMLRVLAWCMRAGEKLEFGRGLSTDGDPALWELDDTGAIIDWVELGVPDLRTVRKAAGKSEHVLVLAYDEARSAPWWESLKGDFSKISKLAVVLIHDDEAKALGSMATRNMKLAVTIQDGVFWVSNDHSSLQIDPEWLRILQENDLLLLISNSGKTREIVELTQLAHNLNPNLKYIVITGNADSPLARESDICLCTGHPDEVCALGMTPTTSTTVMTVIGDILVVETMKKTGFTIEEYSKRHHGGYLGERSRELSK